MRPRERPCEAPDVVPSPEKSQRYPTRTRGQARAGDRKESPRILSRVPISRNISKSSTRIKLRNSSVGARRAAAPSHHGNPPDLPLAMVMSFLSSQYPTIPRGQTRHIMEFRRLPFAHPECRNIILPSDLEHKRLRHIQDRAVTILRPLHKVVPVLHYHIQPTINNLP